MTGKVFQDSANVYQDQAKVLFEYYKKAAEKIVGEQKRIEEEKAEIEALREKASKKMSLFKILGFVTLILAVGLIFLILFFKTRKQIEEYDQRLAQLDEEYKNIRTDYAINKIGVAYVPVATRVPFEGKSFLVDHTKKVNETNFQLTVLHNPENFKEALGKLKEGMETVPLVENNEMPEEIDTSNYSTSIQNITLHDHVGNIDRQVRNISYLLTDSERVSVSLPVITPDSEEEHFINEFATYETGNKPIVPVFDVQEFDSKLQTFTVLNSMKNQINTAGESDNTEYMKALMVQLAETVQLLTQTKASGSSKLINYTTRIFENVLKASYNEYSPALEAEEIERIRTVNFDYQACVNDYKPFSLKQGSRVKYDLISGNWVAEDGSRTSIPFGMHQIDEEVLMPIIQNLMEENRIERLKIYNNIEDQKRSYLEKWTSETGAYFRDNRKSADELITHMREAYADYTSSYTTYKSLMKTQEMLESQGMEADGKVVAEDAQNEMIAGFELQASQCNKQQEEFADFMDRIQEDINESKDRFGHVEYFEASLRDAESHNMAVSMTNIQNLDPRKRQLVGVSPYFAQNAEIPPLPNTQPEMMADIDIDLINQVRQSLETLEAAKNATEEAMQESEETDENLINEELDNDDVVETDEEYDEEYDGDEDSEDDDSEDDEEYDGDEDSEDDDSEDDEEYDGDEDSEDDDSEDDEEYDGDEDSEDDDSEDDEEYDGDEDSEDDDSEDDEEYDGDEDSEDDEDEESEDDDSEDDEEYDEDSEESLKKREDNE